jgi:hypothetical protein
MQSRVQKHLFEYQAAQADRIFSPKTNGVPSESFRTQRDRVTMLWEARDLVENFSPAKQILTKFAENIAPSEYAPTTGNRNYDQQVSDFFHDWCRRCDFEGRHGFKKLMEIAVQTRPVDGDCGFILRRLADGVLVVSEPYDDDRDAWEAVPPSALCKVGRRIYVSRYYVFDFLMR